MKRSLIPSLIVATLLIGCNTGCPKNEVGGPGQRPLEISGQTIDSIGQTFAQAGHMYERDCRPQVSRPALQPFCAAMATFGPKFQAEYRKAVDTWEAGRRANDAAQANGVVPALLDLSAELADILLRASQANP